MKIWIDGNEANIENRVGVNQYAFQVLKHLEAIPESKKHEFTIILKDEPLADLPKERKGWSYKVLSGRGLWILTKLTPYLWFAKDRPDVFFSLSHYSPLFAPCATVMSVMDLGYLEAREQFKVSDYYQLKFWTQVSMRQAKKIIAISNATKEDIIKRYPWTEGKVEVTHLAYDKDKFKITNYKLQIERLKEKYGIKGKYLLYLGTLKPSKNIDGIIQAFSLLEDKSLSLVIAGKKGWLYDEIFGRVTDLGLEDKVIFTDFVAEDDKAPLVAGAEVFVSPSFWEGFGIHLLEATAVGTPVVTSNVGSMPEVVGDAGILVDPYDPKDIKSGMETALKHKKEWSKKGLARVKLFSWEKTAQQALEILESTTP